MKNRKAKVLSKFSVYVNAQGREALRSILPRDITGEQGLRLGFVDFLTRDIVEIGKDREDSVTVVLVSSGNQG